MRQILILGGLVCLTVSTASAQDPFKVDPKHYKVEFENAQVRVLRITYGPHEKSVMHYHPDSLAVVLTEEHVPRETVGALDRWQGELYCREVHEPYQGLASPQNRWRRMSRPKLRAVSVTVI